MSFEKLLQLNVNDKVEKKNGLSYLSWSFAWSNFKKEYPTATYKVKTFENGLPYIYDANTGYMVFTEVTVDGLTHEMWLPVMDGANKAMKSESYTYKTKYAEKEVAAATMFDINKTIMRCLVKNLAMFGLGLYIYAGEDLPEEPYQLPKNYLQNLQITAKENNYDSAAAKKLIKEKCNKESSKDLTVDEAKALVKHMKANPIEKKEEANE